LKVLTDQAYVTVLFF